MFSFQSKVTEGNGVAGSFGVPTANLINGEVVFSEGVYAVSAIIEGQEYAGVLHHGGRPTFGQKASTELHLLNYSGGDFYASTAVVRGIKKIRDIEKFQNADALFTQIQTDIMRARKWYMREKISQKWAEITLDTKQQKEEKAVNILISILSSASYICAYSPTKKELNFLFPLAKKLPNATWSFPMIAKNEMRLHDCAPEKLLLGKWGIGTPPSEAPMSNINALSVVLVPAVAVSQAGARLGRGGGFYDDFLQKLPNNILTISVMPDFAVLDEIPSEPHDMRVQKVISV